MHRIAQGDALGLLVSTPHQIQPFTRRKPLIIEWRFWVIFANEDAKSGLPSKAEGPASEFAASYRV
jgi:hypothetical protein